MEDSKNSSKINMMPFLGREPWEKLKLVMDII